MEKQQPGMGQIIGKYPSLGILVNLLGAYFLRNSKHDNILSELVGALASKINGCHFCYTVHKWAAIYMMAKKYASTTDITELTEIVERYLEYGEYNSISITDNCDEYREVFYLIHKVMNKERISFEITKQYAHYLQVASAFKFFNSLVEVEGGSATQEEMQAIGKSLAENGYGKLDPELPLCPL